MVGGQSSAHAAQLGGANGSFPLGQRVHPRMIRGQADTGVGRKCVIRTREKDGNRGRIRAEELPAILVALEDR